MPKLSEEQITRATTIMYFEPCNRTAVEKIAPLVQFPWEPLTRDEEKFIYGFPDGFIASFNALIASRNASLLPKPVDPRVAIVEEIAKGMSMSDTYSDLAVRILAALDNTQSR